MKKIRYMDGLRGLAAFVVVLNHFALAFYPALFFGSDVQSQHIETFMSGSVFNIFYNGNFAVCIFFVLSGFVLSHKFFLQKDHEIITESAVKRYVRLAIPVAMSIFVAFIFMRFSLFYNRQVAVISGSGWFGDFWNFKPNFLDALNQIFIKSFFADGSDYNSVLWTIAFEFSGSFLVFGFLALFGKIKNRYWAYLVAIIFFFQTYYLAFILGVLLSDLMAHKNMLIREFDRSKLIRTALLFWGLFLGSYPSGRAVTETVYAFLEKPFLLNSSLTYHISGAFLVIAVLLDSKRMQKIFSSRYLLFLGEISFAMYLLHFIILGSFTSFIFLKLAPHLPYFEAVLVSFVISIGIIFWVSYFMYLYVDKKAVHFSKVLYNRIFKNIG
jgi:peptidoglycan/LPS O-acetylase OafA/YrhL